MTYLNMLRTRCTATLLFYLLLVCTSITAQEFGSWDVPIPDLESWWKPVANHEPLQAGEHPRLLFRQQDLPALRKKMATTEGKALIQRLRFLLNGINGEGMPVAFNTAKKAYTLGPKKQSVVDTPGVYTFGHVAGYGLLYQLTGEAKYAEWGRQCFELALAGQRDRDDRYSWVDPGGALRAGPVLGWMAVGYDLCYNAWDKATREKLGKAIENYSTDIVRKWGNVHVNLESMVSGVMPPKSNHYGMQVGGTAMALLAIDQEPWVDQARIDSLLAVNTRSMVHNITQGFGDGGYFAEGDGTGSMASQIAYLTSLQAWKQAKGMDFVNVDRPNARMTALKWLYLTVVKDGHPEIWPIRGGYPHNVWSREGISGAGYFSLPFGVLSASHSAALKWFYEHFLLEADLQTGMPYELSDYPHLVVAAFVNWPTELSPKNPAKVLPLSYRDSKNGFYAWRNRWQDANDVVITTLTQDVRGFMKEEADTSFHIMAFGEKITWGNIPGEVKYWHQSPNGTTSTLVFDSGLSVGVDLSGKSGAEVVLIANGDFEGEQIDMNGQTVTVKYLTQKDSTPRLRMRGKRIKLGKRRIEWKDGQWIFR